MSKNIEIVRMAVQQVAVIFDRLQKAILFSAAKKLLDLNSLPEDQ